MIRYMKNKDIQVLLVDDDHQVQIAYKAAFEAYEIGFKQAFGGKEALEILKTFTPNLILLDILMPEMNGIELLEIIKKDDVLKKIPVVVISNSVKESDMEAAEKLGAEEYIVKSNISIETLMEKTKLYAKKN